MGRGGAGRWDGVTGSEGGQGTKDGGRDRNGTGLSRGGGIPWSGSTSRHTLCTCLPLPSPLSLHLRVCRRRLIESVALTALEVIDAADVAVVEHVLL